MATGRYLLETKISLSERKPTNRAMTGKCGAVVGALRCQRDSFLKELTTTVVSCEADGKARYAVEFEDTVLFPEGGGQPSDQGTVAIGDGGKSVFVEHVRRDGLRAVHVVKEPLDVGSTVKMTVDWARRLDHMQQHTGQHLLSAILENRWGLGTLGWSMGEMVNYIELARKLTAEELEQLGREVNDKIVASIGISVDEAARGAVSEGKMPGDYDLDKGVLRVVKIGEIDRNPCCGTHLASTAQIQAVALLNQVSGKGTNARLNFLAGDRVRRYAESAFRVLKESCAELSCQSEGLPDKLRQLSLGLKKSTKSETSWKELCAQHEARELLAQLAARDVVAYYKPDCALDFLMLLYKASSKAVPPGKTVLLVCGEGAAGGAVIAYGDPAKVQEVTKQLQEMLPGLRGGGKGKWQGKIASFDKGEAESVARYVASLNE